MAENAAESIERAGGGIRNGIEGGADFYRDNLDAIMASNHALINGFQAVNAEALAFLQARMKETLETSQRLAACRKLEDAFEAQIDFMRSSVQAYADEFKRMTEVSGQLFGNSLAPLTARAGEVEKTVARAA